MLLIIFLVLVTLVTTSISDTKVWMYNTGIDDRQNWIDGKIQTDCNGLVFSEHNSVAVFINNLRIRQLVLPKYGTVWFEEGATVLFEEDSRDDLNCVELKSFLANYWYNETLWKNLENPDNPAVPFTERLPCKYDDVVMPSGFNSSIAFVFGNVPVKSVKFGKEELTQKEIYDLTNSEIGDEVFPVLARPTFGPRGLFEITGKECMDPTGCDRRPSLKDINIVQKTNLAKSQCYSGIDIIGNLEDPICGAQILIKATKDGFTIDKINEKLKEFKSYTYASKYNFFNKNHLYDIQIIFTEKNFTGSSLIEATEFYNVLREDDSYFCTELTLKTSGPPLNASNARLRNAVSITFGTLLGVLFMFGLLFFAYSPTVRNLNLRNRLRSGRPLSTYILRYNSIDDSADIIDGQSIAGSVLTLHRSFENPLYDQGPSTRSTSDETIASPKLEEDDQNTNDKTIVLDSAKELEDIDLHNDEASKNDDVLIKDL